MFRALLSNRKYLLALIVGVVILGALVVIVPIAQRPYSPPIPAGKEIEVLRIAWIAGLEDVESGFYPYGAAQGVTGAAFTTHYLEPLVNLDADLHPYGILAERWINPEPTVWRFFLVKNATFSSGSKFDADDVVFTVNTIKNGEYGEFTEFLAPVSEVRKVNQYTVDIVTEKPNPILLSNLRYAWMLSDEDFDPTDPNHPPVGTGPYLITGAKRDTFIELTRRDDYWAELPKPKKVIYRVIEDDEARTQALLNGEIDIAEYMPVSKRAEFDANPEFRTMLTGEVYVWVIGLDMMRDETPYVVDKETGKSLAKNPLKDKRVRQALYYAINIDELIQNTYEGVAESQSQMVPKEVFGYDPSLTRLPYDPEEAKSLLAEAGYPDGFAINIDTRHPRISFYAEEIARQWGKIGIKTTVVTRREEFTSAEDRERFEKGDTSCYFTATAGDRGDAQPVLSTFLHSQVGDYGVENVAKYSNSEVNSLVEQAVATLDQKERLELMQRAQRIALVDDAAYIPVNTDGILYFIRDNLIWEPRIDNLIYGFEVAGK